MAKHYKNKSTSSLGMPKDTAQGQGDYSGGSSQMGKSYYGKGHGNPANMPMQPEISMYPKGRPYIGDSGYSDTMSELDSDAHASINKLNSQLTKKKY